MFLKEKKSGDLVRIENPGDLFDPMKRDVQDGTKPASKNKI